ncbi:hypothetical protein FFONT_0171 [Fervidicoccus fontis Kam940]|uniref:Uncharacterized protein n=1 Tax=Fervidicoccus fontis (strain DSM 19380 / JCM 18336 / VKM B-2539 / Kam940) TaxID=1163730 RepID=H9ZZK6_FERFK|nr:hypothetical protein FFONT_0171 [Fervidicoccus fontis Kam940]
MHFIKHLCSFNMEKYFESIFWKSYGNTLEDVPLQKKGV